MTARLTGLASGLDTETIITQMLSGHKLKVDNAKNDKKKLQWKKEAWASLNTKLYNFYNNGLSKFKSVGTYKAKKVTSTDEKAVTVNASNSAVVGTHTLSVTQVASSAYLTSKSIKGQAFNATSYTAAAGTKDLADLTDKNGDTLNLVGKSFDVSYTDADGNTQTKTITARAGADGTLQSVIDNMNADLGAEGLDLTVSLKDGALSFTNTSGTEQHDDAEDPTKITGYTGGTDFKISTADDAAASALGIKTAGVTVAARKNSADTGEVKTNAAFYEKTVSETPAAVTGSTKLSDMGIAEGTTFKITVGKGDNAKEYEFAIDKNTTLAGLAGQFSKMGVQANYDEKHGTFFLNSTQSGEDYDFTLTSDSATALSKLGLDAASAHKEDAKDAIVVYNGATFQQASNDFSLNGLNFTVNDVVSNVKMTVTNDTDAVYNAVKDFIKEYNALIKEMNTLYNADSAKDYDMLTDEKKESMSDDEVKDWEDKIKASLLRRDSTISSLLSTMRSSLNKSAAYTGSDGVTKNYSLASFGIVTGTWSENGQLHIEGDEDDSAYSSMTNKLRQAIADNPEALMNTLSELGNGLYKSFQKAMKSSTTSSALTFYNDKDMDSKISGYDDKISKLTEKMNKVEDKYYKQFAAMESALAKLQSQQSSFASYFGGN